MGIYLIVLVMGLSPLDYYPDGERDVSAWAGPLPYDMAECENRADEFRCNTSQHLVSEYGEDFSWAKYVCLELDEAPEMGTTESELYDRAD